MSKFIIDVDGMVCRNCEEMVEEEIANQCCIETVAADAPADEVAVAGPVSAIESVVETIESLGYTVED
ncbi:MULTISPECIES: heavy-metal-associated domain-containing protein [Halomicrobium]|uniref:Heavy-metal-associated protein n=2 Tax=Halomicrobium mukohataei TaxID=57705 RepID=C7P141_HALMD|nr:MULTISPECIES: heavy metal-associated domain-containing protein [Halomicrobium]ACV49056.1 heavy-metal-associated protein [Halomicrobium mukohataei DSM 12286]QCD64476.1 heavy-metal-associated domain-containing protein [Halomicrobium mukohataei]QFR19282.1 heavy metal transporter [Halomicrobium sp. ZPS1]